MPAPAPAPAPAPDSNAALPSPAPQGDPQEPPSSCLEPHTAGTLSSRTQLSSQQRQPNLRCNAGDPGERSEDAPGRLVDRRKEHRSESSVRSTFNSSGSSSTGLGAVAEQCAADLWQSGGVLGGQEACAGHRYPATEPLHASATNVDLNSRTGVDVEALCCTTAAAHRVEAVGAEAGDRSTDSRHSTHSSGHSSGRSSRRSSSSGVDTAQLLALLEALQEADELRTLAEASRGEGVQPRRLQPTRRADLPADDSTDATLELAIGADPRRTGDAPRRVSAEEMDTPRDQVSSQATWVPSSASTLHQLGSYSAPPNTGDLPCCKLERIPPRYNSEQLASSPSSDPILAGVLASLADAITDCTSVIVLGEGTVGYRMDAGIAAAAEQPPDSLRIYRGDEAAYSALKGPDAAHQAACKFIEAPQYADAYTTSQGTDSSAGWIPWLPPAQLPASYGTPQPQPTATTVAGDSALLTPTHVTNPVSLSQPSSTNCTAAEWVPSAQQPPLSTLPASLSTPQPHATGTATASDSLLTMAQPPFHSPQPDTASTATATWGLPPAQCTHPSTSKSPQSQHSGMAAATASLLPSPTQSPLSGPPPEVAGSTIAATWSSSTHLPHPSTLPMYQHFSPTSVSPAVAARPEHVDWRTFNPWTVRALASSATRAQPGPTLSPVDTLSAVRDPASYKADADASVSASATVSAALRILPPRDGGAAGSSHQASPDGFHACKVSSAGAEAMKAKADTERSDQGARSEARGAAPALGAPPATEESAAPASKLGALTGSPSLGALLAGLEAKRKSRLEA